MGRAPTNTKQKLTDTARELIWSESYNAVSVDEICKKADVKKGSFYHYFPSKSHLALEVMQRALDETKKKYDDFFSPSRPPIERFKLMAQHVIDQQKEISAELGHVCGCPFAALGSEMASQDSGLGDKVKTSCSQKTAYYQSGLRDLIAAGLIDEKTNVESKANEIFSFIIGLLIVARINNDLSFLENNLQKALFDLIGVKRSALEA